MMVYGENGFWATENIFSHNNATEMDCVGHRIQLCQFIHVRIRCVSSQDWAALSSQHSLQLTHYNVQTSASPWNKNPLLTDSGQKFDFVPDSSDFRETVNVNSEHEQTVPHCDLLKLNQHKQQQIDGGSHTWGAQQLHESPHPHLLMRETWSRDWYVTVTDLLRKQTEFHSLRRDNPDWAALIYSSELLYYQPGIVFKPQSFIYRCWVSLVSCQKAPCCWDIICC